MPYPKDDKPPKHDIIDTIIISLIVISLSIEWSKKTQKTFCDKTEINFFKPNHDYRHFANKTLQKRFTIFNQDGFES